MQTRSGTEFEIESFQGAKVDVIGGVSASKEVGEGTSRHDGFTDEIEMDRICNFGGKGRDGRVWREKMCAVGEETKVKREVVEFCYGGIWTKSGCDGVKRRGFMRSWEEMGGGFEEMRNLRQGESGPSGGVEGVDVEMKDGEIREGERGSEKG